MANRSDANSVDLNPARIPLLPPILPSSCEVLHNYLAHIETLSKAEESWGGGGGGGGGGEGGGRCSRFREWVALSVCTNVTVI